MSFVPKKAVIEYSWQSPAERSIDPYIYISCEVINSEFFLKENPQQGHDLSGIVWKIEHKS